jgi:hypothetical protein
MEINWYKIAKIIMASDESLAAWILPNGKVVRVNSEGHEWYVRKNLSKFGITENEFNRGFDAYSLAFNHGAVRISGWITEQNKIMGVEGDYYSFKKFRDIIYEIAKSNKISKINCQIGGQYKSVSIEEFYSL